MTAHDMSRAVWRRSTRSNGSGGSNCVEVASLDGDVAVRDSKNTDGGVIQFAHREWEAFINGAKGGEFDL